MRSQKIQKINGVNVIGTGREKKLYDDGNNGMYFTYEGEKFYLDKFVWIKDNPNIGDLKLFPLRDFDCIKNFGSALNGIVLKINNIERTLQVYKFQY